MAVRKLSGVAVPSCSWGSSQRDARPACQARTSLPLAAAAAPAGDESESAVEAATTSIRSAPSRGHTVRAGNRERLMSGPPLAGSSDHGEECRRLARAQGGIKRPADSEARGTSFQRGPRLLVLHL